MRKLLLVTLAAAILSVTLQAQTAIPTNRLSWSQSAPTLVEAQALTYRYYPDSSVTGIVLTVTCSGTAAPFQCETPFPAFSPGVHTLRLTAANVAGESEKSLPLGFTFVVVPAIPTNLIIK